MNCVSCGTANVDVKSIRHCQNEFFRIFSRKCFYRAILVLFFSSSLPIWFSFNSFGARKRSVNITLSFENIFSKSIDLTVNLVQGKCQDINVNESVMYDVFFIFDFKNAPILRRLARKFLLFTVILMMFIFFCICFFFTKLLSHVIHAYGTWEMKF